MIPAAPQARIHCSKPPTPGERALLRARLGAALVQRFGKRASYRAREVLEAFGSLPFPFDWSCWGLATFTQRAEFDAHHALTGESCDWAAMHGLMTEIATASGDSAWSVTDILPDLSSVGDLVAGAGDLLP